MNTAKIGNRSGTREVGRHERGTRTLFAAKLLTCVMLGFIVTSTGPAAQPVWRSFGPGGGGWIEDVVAHPKNSGEAWAMTDLTGLFQTTDGGLTWHKRTAAIEYQVLARKQIASANRQFAIDPSDPRHMYWGTCDCVWASHDGGRTWELSWGTLPEFGDEARLARGITLSVGPEGTVYALDRDYILRVSSDRGANWRERTTPPVAKGGDLSTPPFPLAAPDGTLYVSARPKPGLAVSRDGGKTWELKLADRIVLNAKFASDGQTRPRTLFALAADGTLFRTTDGGRSFKPVAQAAHWWQPGRRHAGGLAVSPAGTILLWCQDEQLRSPDWGATWEPFSITERWSMGSYAGMNRRLSPEGKTSQMAVSCDGRIWYSCDSSLMARSTDEGRSWTGCTDGLQILCYWKGPCAALRNPDRVFVGSLDQGAFVTNDGGQTWEAVNVNPAVWGRNWRNNDVSVIKQDPHRPRIWYAVWHSHGAARKPLLFRSVDDGKTWSLLLDVQARFGGSWGKFLSTDQITDLVFDPEDEHTIHLSNAVLGVMTSRDGGRTWNHTLQASGGFELAISPSGRHLYLQCWKKRGLYASHDRGRRWTLARRESWGVDGIAHHPQQDETLYITTGQLENYWDHKGSRPGSLWKSTDAGRTWQNLGQYDGGAIYVDPIQPNIMLMSTLAGGKGILRSVDSGKTWHPFNAGAPSYTCRGFTYGGRPGRVYYYMYGHAAVCDELYRE